MNHPAHVDAIGRESDLDLGDNHALWFTQWSPDRQLNPQWADVPDEPFWGAIVSHLKPDGTVCYAGVTFMGPVQDRIAPRDTTWQVISREPLTLSPSLLCLICGDHGFIREGRWVKA